MKDVPIIVDSEWLWHSEPMIRGVVFTIESEGGTQGWNLGVRGLNIPILLLGLSAIVTNSPNTGGEFVSPQDVEDLFTTVEGQADLEIETSDVWLPARLFKPPGGHIKRGNVFRVPLNLFAIAWRVRTGQLDLKRLFGDALFESRVHFSEQETRSFSAWAKEQWYSLRSRPKNRDLSLPRQRTETLE